MSIKVFLIFTILITGGCKHEEVRFNEKIEDVTDEEWVLISPFVKQNGPRPPGIIHIQFIDDEKGFALTAIGEREGPFILSTINGGNTWKKISPVNEEGQKLSFSRLFVKNSEELYLLGQTINIEHRKRGLYKSLDGGYNWELVLEKSIINNVIFLSPNRILCSSSGDLFISNDNGNSWNELYSSQKNGHYPIQRIKFIDNLTGYGSYGTVFTTEPPYCCTTFGFSFFFKTIDGGLNWFQLQADDKPLEAVINWNFINSETGFGFTYNEKLLKTSDGGHSWQVIQEKLPSVVTSSHFIDNRTGYYGSAGDKGILFKTTDGGKKWKRSIPTYLFIDSDNTENIAGIYHICFTSSGTGYAAGEYGTIWKLKSK
jgi:photosystem II stability/assembly factor-like uncharacterized protein